MKVIFSHDIDHLTVSEHLTDLIIPKHIARNLIELLKGKISFAEFFRRLGLLFSNKWQNISELIEYNRSQNIPGTFFIGVSNGKGLNYSNKKAEKWIKKIIASGSACGVHGIAFSEKSDIENEFKRFSELSGTNKFGIRMHYLRNDDNTLKRLSEAGYRFDSSEYALKAPYKINNMWEFPLHIMDGYIIEAGKKWQSVGQDDAIKNTIKRIEEIENSGIEYLTILFHDRYFSPAFKTWMEWYMGVVEYCKNKNYTFISYDEAIKELEC